MKRVTVVLALLFAGVALLSALPADRDLGVRDYQSDDHGLTVTLGTGKLRISPVPEGVIRVTYAPEGAFSDRPSLVVVDRERQQASFSVEENGDSIVVSAGKVSIRIDKATGSLGFLDPDGKVVLAEPANGGRSARKAKVQGERVWHVKQEFDFAKGEALYGLGQFQNGYMNYRGKKLLLMQSNKVAVNPFLVSTRGYGILWDNYSETKFDDTRARSEGTSTGRLWSEVADKIDYYFIYGPELDQVVSGYRELTGRAPLYPKWAYGYFQSKERYKSFDEMAEVVAEYRSRQLPLDTIVLDWQYWGDLGWNPLMFDESGPFKDPAARIKEIHDMDAHIIVSIWPNVTNKSEVYAELKASGHLLSPRALTMEPADTSLIYDAYSEEARKIYWKHLKKNIFDKGMDGFWMDATEPETGLTFTQGLSGRAIKRLGRCELGTLSRYLNTYSLMTTGGVYKGWRESGSDKRVYILTRSAFAGQQRYAATTWSGDITAKWPVLRKQIPAGLNFCMAGIPYWTTDIGGFFVETNRLSRTERYKDPDYRELYVRWFQYGTFCPIFRSHGTNTPREIWRFGEPGEETYDTLHMFDDLRYRLMPYLYSLAWRVTSENYTIMRGLAMDFRHDPRVYDIADQFMFGPAFMANPVTEPLKIIKSRRQVYLPEGADWYDFWTGERLQGGQKIEAYAPLTIMPLYVRAGSIVPMGPIVQYATEKSDPIELRIYPGADASFTLYEDENDNYNYEKGAYSTIELTWNDSTGTLTLGERKGTYPGMKEKRTFNVVLVEEVHGIAVWPEKQLDGTLIYSGREMTAVLK